MFWNIFRPRVSLKESGIFDGATDWHCHLLPGVDDGVQRMDDTLKILALYARLGIRRVWLTPHIMEDVPNDPDRLRARFAELKTAYRGPIELNLAAENMMDSLFEKRLTDGILLPLGEDGDHLLVETSYFNPPMGLYDILREVQSKGYHPVLAHPERYLYMDDADYDRLHEMDIRLQLNLFSLVGGYGGRVQKNAIDLLKKGYYSYKGTDTHRFGQFNYFTDKKIPKDLVERIKALK